MCVLWDYNKEGENEEGIEIRRGSQKLFKIIFFKKKKAQSECDLYVVCSVECGIFVFFFLYLFLHFC